MKPEFFIGGELNGQDKVTVYPQIPDSCQMIRNAKTILGEIYFEEYWRAPILIGADEWILWVNIEGLQGSSAIAVATAFSLVLSNHFEVCSKKLDGND
jgi:hypothetical protein